MIVRCQSGLPAVGEVLEPFANPHYVAGWMRGSHNGPLMPCALDDSTPARFDGPPRVVAMGFQLADGQLVGPRDMLGDISFDRARQQALEMADYMRRNGPVRAGPSADRRHGIHDDAAGRRADARALGADRGTGPDPPVPVSGRPYASVIAVLRSGDGGVREVRGIADTVLSRRRPPRQASCPSHPCRHRCSMQAATEEGSDARNDHPKVRRPALRRTRAR